MANSRTNRGNLQFLLNAEFNDNDISKGQWYLLGTEV